MFPLRLPSLLILGKFFLHHTGIQKHKLFLDKEKYVFGIFPQKFFKYPFLLTCIQLKQYPFSKCFLKFYRNCCPFKNCFGICGTKFSQRRLFLKPTTCFFKCENTFQFPGDKHSKELCKVILTDEIGIIICGSQMDETKST